MITLGMLYHPLFIIFHFDNLKKVESRWVPFSQVSFLWMIQCSTSSKELNKLKEVNGFRFKAINVCKCFLKCCTSLSQDSHMRACYLMFKTIVFI